MNPSFSKPCAMEALRLNNFKDRARTKASAKLGSFDTIFLYFGAIEINFGVFDGIAYKKIIPTIKGSEFEGYEDIFIEKAILHFEKTAIQATTKELKASTFVTWWVKNKVFESGDVWADILEKVVNHKKQLQKTNPTAYENRQLARTMTNNEFEEYIKKMQE